MVVLELQHVAYITPVLQLSCHSLESEFPLLALYIASI
jgi:hypothetical protein